MDDPAGDWKDHVNVKHETVAVTALETIDRRQCPAWQPDPQQPPFDQQPGEPLRGRRHPMIKLEWKEVLQKQALAVPTPVAKAAGIAPAGKTPAPILAAPALSL